MQIISKNSVKKSEVEFIIIGDRKTPSEAGTVIEDIKKRGF